MRDDTPLCVPYFFRRRRRPSPLPRHHPGENMYLDSTWIQRELARGFYEWQFIQTRYQNLCGNRIYISNRFFLQDFT